MNSKKRNKVIATITGTGCALFAIHNIHQPFLETLFLPAVGMILMLTGSIFHLLTNKRDLNIGKPIIYIPMLIIAASITISGIINNGVATGFSLLVFSLSMFVIYSIARTEGLSITRPFQYLVILTTTGLIAWQFTSPGIRSGGWFLSPTNYDIAAGVLILGTLLSSIGKQWWLSIIAVTGLFLCGAEEGLFALFILAIATLVRKDWSYKASIPAVVLVFLLIICTPLGITEKLASPATEKISLTTEALASENPTIRDQLLNEATNDRWNGNWSLSPIRPFGYGYTLFSFYVGIPHNIALIIIEQIGILAVLCWFWITIYTLIKGQRKYLIIAILALGIFDHFIWTQLAPWWWIAIGLSLTTTNKDYIFRRT